MSRHHRRKKRFKLRSFYIWHRYMGVAAAAFMVLVAVTGVLMNHPDRLGIDDKFVDAGWVLDWYGIHTPDDLLSFRAGDHYVSRMGKHLYLDTREFEGRYRDLVGAVRVHELLAIAVDDSILLLTPDGELVERLHTRDGVPAGLLRIGTDPAGDLVLEGGLDLWTPDADFLRWQPWHGDRDSLRWSKPQPLPPALYQALVTHYRGEALPLMRLLADLHSGRFFGRYGPWLIDLSALLLVLLSLSGTWIWLRRRR